MEKLRTHWFLAVLGLIGALWIITAIAYASGADGITLHSRYGPDATIDFMRKYERKVLALGDGLGLELSTGGKLHGTIVKLERGFPVACWVCGANVERGGLARVAYRQGDWFYRAPEKPFMDERTLNDLSAKLFRTVAYDVVTRERVLVGTNASEAEQAAALLAHHLEVTPANQLSPQALSGMSTVSMMKEGCIIINLAFVAATLLWLVFGGIPAWFLRRRRLARG